MSLPTVEANGVFTQVLPITDLALTTAVSSSVGAVTSTAFTTGVQNSVLVLVKLVSGTMTVDLDRHSAADNADFGSPTESVTISTTNRTYLKVDATSSERYFSIRTSAANTSQFAELAVIVASKLEEGEEWFAIRSGHNAVANATVGDGTGEVAITPA